MQEQAYMLYSKATGLLISEYVSPVIQKASLVLNWYFELRRFLPNRDRELWIKTSWLLVNICESLDAEEM